VVAHKSFHCRTIILNRKPISENLVFVHAGLYARIEPTLFRPVYIGKASKSWMPASYPSPTSLQ
jgi:hypothetical protein